MMLSDPQVQHTGVRKENETYVPSSGFSLGVGDSSEAALFLAAGETLTPEPGTKNSKSRDALETHSVRGVFLLVILGVHCPMHLPGFWGVSHCSSALRASDPIFLKLRLSVITLNSAHFFPFKKKVRLSFFYQSQNLQFLVYKMV